MVKLWARWIGWRCCMRGELARQRHVVMAMVAWLYYEREREQGEAERVSVRE